MPSHRSEVPGGGLVLRQDTSVVNGGSCGLRIHKRRRKCRRRGAEVRRQARTVYTNELGRLLGCEVSGATKLSGIGLEETSTWRITTGGSQSKGWSKVSKFCVEREIFNAVESLTLNRGKKR